MIRMAVSSMTDNTNVVTHIADRDRRARRKVVAVR